MLDLYGKIHVHFQDHVVCPFHIFIALILFPFCPCFISETPSFQFLSPFPSLSSVVVPWRNKLRAEDLDLQLILVLQIAKKQTSSFGQQFKIGGTGSMPDFAAGSSYLALMASVVPTEVLPHRSSFASSYGHDSASDRFLHFAAPVESDVDEQSLPTDWSGRDEDMPLSSFNDGCYNDYSGDESDSAADNEPMQQEIAVCHSSDEIVRCQRTDENQPKHHIDQEIAVGYSSGEDGASQRIAMWERTSPLAHNDRIIGAVEQAMRKSSDGTNEHMFLPTVGAIFPSLGDAYQFYNLYSWVVGFSIQKGTNQDGKINPVDGTKERNMQEYRCQRAGKPSSRKRSTTMCGCPARLRLFPSLLLSTIMNWLRAVARNVIFILTRALTRLPRTWSVTCVRTMSA